MPANDDVPTHEIMEDDHIDGDNPESHSTFSNDNEFDTSSEDDEQDSDSNEDNDVEGISYDPEVGAEEDIADLSFGNDESFSTDSLEEGLIVESLEG